MPSRPTHAPDTVGAGYRRFQRRMARTTELTDLNRVVPQVARRVRNRYSGFARAFPLPAVLGVGAALVLVAVIFSSLSASTTKEARTSSPAGLDDARPVSLQVSGGFGVDGAFMREPDPLADPNTTAGDAGSDPLSRLLGGLQGGSSSAAGSDAAGSAASGSGAAPATSGRAATTADLASPELVRLYNLTNSQRTSRGLEPLQLDLSLIRSAQLHADWMAEHGVLCHSNECDPGGEPDSATWNGWGENIAYSVRPSADVVQTAFLDSAPHKANMLDPRHRYIGLGWATGPLAGTNRLVMFVVVQFGMQRR